MNYTKFRKIVRNYAIEHGAMSPEDILRFVADKTGISELDISGKVRKREYVAARIVFSGISEIMNNNMQLAQQMNHINRNHTHMIFYRNRLIDLLPNRARDPIVYDTVMKCLRPMQQEVVFNKIK